MGKLAKNIGLLALFVPLATGEWFLGGYVTSILWGWFVAEPFGIVAISTLQAMGLGCVVACFTWTFARSSEIKDAKEGDRTRWERSFYSVFLGYLVPSLLLLTGWALRQIG